MSSDVPEGWATQQVGQVARIVTGKTPSTKDDRFWNGEVPFVTPSDIGDSPWCDTVERHLSKLGASTVSTAPAGAVLFTCIASIGKSCILSETSAFNQQINACIPGPSTDSYFLYSQLQAMGDDIRHLAGTTAVPIINKSTFSAIPIWLPPLDEQRRIADVLRSVDEAIVASKEASNATQHVFARVRAELLEAASTNYDEVVVADAITKNRGQKLKKLQTSDYLEDGAFPIIDQGAAFVCGFTDDETALWPYDLPVIVFGDHTRILKYVDFPFVIGADGTQCITPAAGFDARYLYYALQSLDLRGEGYARHFKLLKEKSIPIPTLRRQREIAEQLYSFENAISAADETTERLVETKRTLMSDLLSGRVRVPVVAASASKPVPAPFKRAVFAAEIVNQLHNDNRFGSVKHEKIVHLCELHLGLQDDLDRHAYKEAAGPYDPKARRSVERIFQQQKWFDATKPDGNRVVYVPLEKAGGHFEYFDRYFGEQKTAIQSIIDLLRPLNTEQCEIVATLYAVWNDFLIDGKQPTEQEIVATVLQWHPKKHEIAEDRWLAALPWMRQKGLVPKGVGEKTRVAQA